MKRLTPILSIFLALLVLLSSTSFMVGMHRCNGELKEISFLSDADGCGHQKNVPPCHRAHEKSCCENGNVVHEGTDFSHHVSGFELVPFALAFPVVVTNVVISLVIPESAASQLDLPDYDIPIPVSDRPVANCVLLI